MSSNEESCTPGHARPAPGVAVKRGLAGRCPLRGEGRVFQGFPELVPGRTHCGTAPGRPRPDDAAPCAVILIAGHVQAPDLCPARSG